MIEFGREWVVPGSSSDLLGLGQGLHINKRERILCKVAVMTPYRALCLEWNKKIFEAYERELESIWERLL